MGGNGSFSSGHTSHSIGRKFRTIGHIGDNIKILQNKKPNAPIKLPEESHTPNRVYAVFNKVGKDVKAVAQYGPDGKKLFEIHTTDHKGLGIHYHLWQNGKVSEPQKVTPAMMKLLNRIRNFSR